MLFQQEQGSGGISNDGRTNLCQRALQLNSISRTLESHESEAGRCRQLSLFLNSPGLLWQRAPHPTPPKMFAPFPPSPHVNVQEHTAPMLLCPVSTRANPYRIERICQEAQP